MFQQKESDSVHDPLLYYVARHLHVWRKCPNENSYYEYTRNLDFGSVQSVICQMYA